MVLAMSAAEWGSLTAVLVMGGLPAYLLIRLQVSRKGRVARYACAASAAGWVWLCAIFAGSSIGLAFALVVTAVAVTYLAPASPEA